MKGLKLFWCMCMILSIWVAAIDCTSVEEFELEPIPNNASYASADMTYDDGGMGPMNDFARSFINSALPGGFDEEFVEDIMDNGFEMSKIQELIKKNIGYVISLALGFLFVLIFPIVGGCFCCCRLCGNCGGNRRQVLDDKIHLKRRIYSGVMFVIAVFILVGNICAYVSNDRLSNALDKVGDTVESNLGDINTFLDQLSLQINTIGDTNLVKTKEATMKYMDNTYLRKSVSGYILDTLSGGALNNMDAHIKELGDIFNEINKTFGELDNAYADLPSCPGTACQIPNPLGPNTALYKLKHEALPKFGNFTQSKPTETAKDQIETKVTNALPNMNDTTTSVNNSFEQIKTKMDDVKDQIGEFRNSTDSGFDTTSMTQKTKDATDTVKKYDSYRHSAGAGLGAMITLVAVLQFVGIGFGMVGQGTKTVPSERGCVSNSGGNMLIASVAFIFIFSSLLMLLTTLCFSVGAVVERFLCQPLSDSKLTMLKVVGKKIPGDLLGNGSFSDIMLGCKNGQTVYEAFPMLSSKFNISKVKNDMSAQQENMLNEMSKSLENITSSIANVPFANSSTENLKDLKASLSSIDFVKIEEQRKNLSIIESMGPATVNYTRAMKTMLDLVKQLGGYKDKVGNWSDEFKKGMDDAQIKIANATAINETVQAFVKKIIDPVNAYVDNTEVAVKTQMGKCSPLWTLYDSIVIISVCKYTLDAFNGFWFSIGWCLFFFVPGVVVAVKLAKHYRTMDSEGDEEDIVLQPIKTNQVAPSE